MILDGGVADSAFCHHGDYRGWLFAKLVILGLDIVFTLLHNITCVEYEGRYIGWLKQVQ